MTISTPQNPTSPTTPEPNLEINCTRQFTSWLHEQQLSVLFTTYQVGKFFMLGLKANGELSIFNRTFNRCMGLCAQGRSLYMSSLYQIWRFENVLAEGERYGEYDALYVPQVAYTTGDVDTHDMAIDNQGQLLFINTLFSCLATLSETHSFKPLWHPPFISKLAAEDRCHLNGLALRDSEPRYVTAVAEMDVHEGWREHRRDGGIVMDLQTNTIIGRGLSMPHSPRYHQNKLWLLNSGHGGFGFLDEATGQFEQVAFCPGYARGLSIHGDFAAVGLSKNRHSKTLSGLAIDEALKSKKISDRCGIQIIDLRTGDIAHSLTIAGMVSEIYDVVLLPNIILPMAIGLRTDEIRRIIHLEQNND